MFDYSPHDLLIATLYANRLDFHKVIFPNLYIKNGKLIVKIDNVCSTFQKKKKKKEKDVVLQSSILVLILLNISRIYIL